QLVSRVKQSGFNLTPKKVFDAPVLSLLAQQMEQSQFIKADQKPLIGEALLLPLQQVFSRQYGVANANQYLQFSLPQALDSQALQQAIALVVKHHDSLRMQQQSNGQIYYVAPEQGNFYFSIHPEADLDHLNRQVDLTLACTLAVLYQENSQVYDNAAMITLVAHHMVVDAYSWRIILADLQTCYQQIKAGTKVAFPRKTHTLNDWQNALSQWSVTAPAWLSQSSHSPLFNQALGQQILTRQVSFDAVQVASWQAQSQTYARLTLEELLLLAVTETLFNRSGQSHCTIYKESHGRFGESFDLDLSQTTGWFTSAYPLTFASQTSLALQVKELKAKSRAVELGGIAYSAQQLQHGVIQSAKDCLFNFLGQVPAHSNWQLLDSGLWRDDTIVADAAVVVNAALEQGQLKVEFEFAATCFSDLEADSFSSQFTESLAEIDNFMALNPAIVTPEDVMAEVSQAELDKLDQNVSDILPATALQQGLVFHSQLRQGSNYINQVCLPMTQLDPVRLQQAWQTLLTRHDTLRAYFAALLGSERVVIAKELSLPWQQHDFTAPSDDTQGDPNERLEKLKQRRVSDGFDLYQGPLWRVDLAQLSADDYACVFTLHHVLMDGWSSGVLFGELLRSYHQQSLPSAVQYAEYLKWLEQQDMAHSLEYWQGYVSQIKAPSLLAEERGSQTNKHGQQRHKVVFSETELAAFNQGLKQHHLTLNTLMQGAWVKTLGQLLNQPQVVFANTVAGRPPALEQANNMVGLFINTLPMVVNQSQSEGWVNWLQQIQQQGVAQREHDFVSLAEIQALANWGSNSLFDTLMVFENYPMDFSQLAAGPNDLQIGEPSSQEQTHYPLTLAIFPSTQLHVDFAYDASRFEGDFIEQVAQLFVHHCQQLFAQMDSSAASYAPLPQAQLDSLASFNPTSAAYQSSQMFSDLVDQQAAQRPEAIALVHGKRRV
ncbi:condensation domain-containing protein, partial [Motilimonas pumila]